MASNRATETTPANLSSRVPTQSAHFTQKQIEIALRNRVGGEGTQNRTHKDRCYFELFYEQWLMAVNPVISTLCEMLTLAKGTHILGLTDTRSHGTISQDFFFFFFLVATEKGHSQRVLIDNGRKCHTAIHIDVS